MKIKIDVSYVDEVLNKSLWKGTVLSLPEVEARRILRIIKEGKYVASVYKEPESVRQRYATNPVNIRYNTIVYLENLYTIGGTETWLLNMLKSINSKKTIMFVYKSNKGTILNSLEPYCTIVQDKPNYYYTCNHFIVASVVSPDIFGRVFKKKAYQFIHADLEGMSQLRRVVYKKDKFIDQLVSVSDVARVGLKNVSNEDSIVLYNPLDKDLRKTKPTLFCTVGRGTKEKGTDRVLALVKLFKEHNKDFLWFLCGTQEEQGNQDLINSLKEYKEVIFVKPSESNKKIMQLCDYTVVPSTTESFCYTAYESLQQGTPCNTYFV